MPIHRLPSGASNSDLTSLPGSSGVLARLKTSNRVAVETDQSLFRAEPDVAVARLQHRLHGVLRQAGARFPDRPHVLADLLVGVEGGGRGERREQGTAQNEQHSPDARHEPVSDPFATGQHLHLEKHLEGDRIGGTFCVYALIAPVEPAAWLGAKGLPAMEIRLAAEVRGGRTYGPD